VLCHVASDQSEEGLGIRDERCWARDLRGCRVAGVEESALQADGLADDGR
jgi:hypothetical protein